MDFVDQDQLDFQLKIHTLQNFIASKQDQVSYHELKMSQLALNSKIDEGKIFILISEVKSTVNNIESFFSQLKSVFHELNMDSILNFFQSITYCLIRGIRLLSNGLQAGIEHNMVQFTKQRQQKIQNTTIATKISQQDILKELQINSIRGNQFYSDIRTKMEIEKIYQNVLLQKHSVERMSSSCAPIKLFEVQKYLNLMVEQTDSTMQQIYTKRNQQTRMSQADKIQPPEALDRIFKVKMTDSMKNCFIQGIEKVTKKMFEQFHKSEYHKMKQEILKLKVKTSDYQVQANIAEQKSTKTPNIVNKDKKTIERMTKQIKDLQKQQEQMIEKYLKLLKQNTKNVYKNENSSRNSNQNIQKGRQSRESITQKIRQRRDSVISYKFQKRQSMAKIQSEKQTILDKDNSDTSKLNIQFGSSIPKIHQQRSKKSKKITISKTKFYHQNRSISDQDKIISKNLLTLSLDKQNCSPLAFDKQQDQIVQNNSFPILDTNDILICNQSEKNIQPQKINHLDQKQSILSNKIFNNGLDVCMELQKHKSQGYKSKCKQIIEKIIEMAAQQQSENTEKETNIQKISHDYHIQNLFNCMLKSIVSDPLTKIQFLSAQQQQKKTDSQIQKQKENQIIPHGEKNSEKINKFISQSSQHNIQNQQKQCFQDNFKCIFKVFNSNFQPKANLKEKPIINSVNFPSKRFQRKKTPKKQVNSINNISQVYFNTCQLNHLNNSENNRVTTFQEIMRATKRKEQECSKDNKSKILQISHKKLCKGRFQKFTGDFAGYQHKKLNFRLQKVLTQTNKESGCLQSKQKKHRQKKCRNNQAYLLKIDSLTRPKPKQSNLNAQNTKEQIINLVHRSNLSSDIKIDMIKFLGEKNIQKLSLGETKLQTIKIIPVHFQQHQSNEYL